MPRHELIPLDARAAWEEKLDGLPHGFHHTWDHANAIHLSSSYPTFLYAFSHRAMRVVCPLVERRFGNYVDIASPSGLAGFTGSGVSPAFADHWAQFVREREYVSGYIPLHPLFSPSALVRDGARRNSLYVLDLTVGLDMLRERMDRNRRRQLRGWDQRAARFTSDPRVIADFLVTHYEHFMDRVGSREPRLSSHALRFLCSSERCLVVGAPSERELEAVYLFGATPHAGECLINVTTPQGRISTTDLVWWGVRALVALGVPALNLGGGAAEDDPVAKAKQRFAPERLPLNVLRQVYRQDVYAELCRDAGVDPSVPTDYFPAYRSRRGVAASPSAQPSARR